MSSRPVGAGERLVAKGDAPDGFYGVADGGVRISTLAADGKEALLAIIESPHGFGEIARFDGQARTHDAWGESASTLLHVPQGALLRLLAEHPAHWQQFGLLLAQKLRVTFGALEEAALLPAAECRARRQETMAEGYTTRREIRVLQDQLGLMLSLSRQTTNQILKQLESRGAIRLARGGIEIILETAVGRRQRAAARLDRARSAVTQKGNRFRGPQSQRAARVPSEGERSTAVSRITDLERLKSLSGRDGAVKGRA